MDKKKIIQENLPFLYKFSIVLILLLVLLNIPPLFSPPAFGKSIPFRIIFSLTLFYFFYDLLFKKSSSIFKRVVEKIRAKKDFSFYTPLILLLLLFVSLFFSIDINFSVFGDPARGGGFLNFAFLMVFAYFLFYLLRDSEWKIVWKTLFFTGVVATFFAILQWQELLGDIIVGQASRPYASFGNPTILGVYLSILIFPIFLFFLKEDVKSKKAVYLSVLLVVIFGMLLSYTRAALLGVALGSLYFVFLFPLKERIFRTLKLGFLFIIVLFSFFFFFVNTYGLPSFVKENSFLQGLTSRMYISTAFGDPRIGGFIIGWNSMLDKPLTGYGVENFAYAFDRHYDPRAPFIYKDIPWWDKAHNLPIEIGTWGGFPAMIALFLIFITLFFSLRKNKSLEAHTVKATLITFFVANLFTVDDFSTYLLFVVIIGYSFHLIIKGSEIDIRKELERRSKFSRYKIGFLVLFIPLLLIFFSKYNYDLLISNRDIAMAEVHQKVENCEIALAYAERAIEKDTPIYSYILFKKMFVIEQCIEEKEEKAEKLFLTIKDFSSKRPSYTRAWTNLGIASLRYLPYAENKEEKLNIAEESFRRALEISPKRYSTHSDLAQVLLQKGEWENALQSAKACLSLVEYNNCYYAEGVATFALGISKEDYFEKLDNELNIIGALNGTINSQIHIKNYQATIPLYLLLIEKDPNNPQNYSSLATAYREIGDYKNARKYALKITEKDPLLIDIVNELLDSLPE